MRTRSCIAVLASALASLSHGAEPAGARQLAADRGCYNCHAVGARPGIRSFAEIAGAYVPWRGKPGAEQQARDRMHHGGLFSHIAAHERLTEEEATVLVHWLFEGGR